MDRNQVIGFVLLALLLIGYIGYNQYEQKQYEQAKKVEVEAKARLKPKTDSLASKAVAPIAPVVDSTTRANMPPALSGIASVVTLENKDLKLDFNTKGGAPVVANLKAYRTYHKKPLILFSGKNNHLSAVLPYDNGRATETLYFTPTIKKENDGSQTLNMAADLGNGQRVDLLYTLPAEGYMMQCNVSLTGMSAAELPLHWQTEGLLTEKDLGNERQAAQVYYRFTDNDNDYFTVREGEEKTFQTKTPVSWVGFRKQYFSSALVADAGFSKTDIKAIAPKGDSFVVAQNTVEAMLPMKKGANGVSANLRWYIGPNDYKTLKSYKIGLDDMIPLGSGIMSFVKYINSLVLIPLFYFLSSFISNYALIIVLLTIFIRLVLSFFTYKSYLSSAKMRVLKPELDELRARVGDDQQKMSVEQMKLYREAGVNPLGGCLPLFFQLPILLSMYYMFPSFIEFRQKSFLWADDLSTYDSIVNFGFTIPFYGDHVSLFTILMTASSLFIAVFNRNMTPQDPNNPMMKYMPYVFPVVLMGVFNKMAAALTFYYTFSNLLSIAQQAIIQKFFINEEAIHAKIKENRSKPPTTSKWQQRIQEMQKMQTDKQKVQPKTNNKK
jgi:YidC/Oxa1 family membrane protein insertase